MASNCYKRNGVYWFRAVIAGKIYHESLQTSEKGMASVRARERRAAIINGKHDLLEQLRVRRTCSTIGQVMEVVQDTPAQMLGLRGESTKLAYLSTLRSVMKPSGLDPNQSISALNSLVVSTFEKSMLEKNASPYSIVSFLTQARALFGRKFMRVYHQAGLIVPALDGFKEGGAVEKPAMRYRLPPATARQPILDALQAEKGKNDGIYKAYLCCYGLAMRAEEAACCKWDWFRRDEEGQQCVWIGSDEFSPKGEWRAVPVPANLEQELRIGQGGEYVLPGATATVRRDLVGRDLAKAMRAAGWKGPKFAHELRKWRGSKWWTDAGPQWAKKWLGHASIQTTEAWYADTTSNGRAVDF